MNVVFKVEAFIIVDILIRMICTRLKTYKDLAEKRKSERKLDIFREEAVGKIYNFDILI